MSTTKKTLLFSVHILFFILVTSSDIDMINETQTIADGETIVSMDGTFEMGFFSPGKSKYRYVGIWYKKINGTVVWVANRDNPLNDLSGKLKVRKPGILVVLNSSNGIIWSSNTSISVENPVAQILDTGNLVIKDASDEWGKNIWQSFDYPGNTILDGMKLGKNFLTGREWYLTSWRSDDDPSPGDYKYGVDVRGYPEVFLWTPSNETFRAGVWIGDRFSGSTPTKPNAVFGDKFIFGEDEVNYTYTYDLLLSSTHPRRVLTPAGVMHWFSWDERRTSWVIYSSGPPVDECDSYNICGAYGNCNINNNPLCMCLEKFIAISPKDYRAEEWSAGCVRRTPLNCQKGDIFLKYSGLKLPDTRNSWFDTTMTLENCRDVCLRNCSCTAYSSMDFTRGSGCLLWFEELMDIQSLSDGQDIYLRMASSETETKIEQNETTKAVPKVASDQKNQEKIIISLTSALGGLLLCLGVALYAWKRKQIRKGINRDIFANSSAGEDQSKDLSLPLFEQETIRSATNNFSISNKLGQGGYGPVYKGVLEGGKKIAVKRLSSCSTQGLEEFKNEVLCIAKLQHRNLVKLLGCCVKGEEKMLIYEYMPNKSLDYFIFDETQSRLLNWPTRIKIINGISRGILYLHQDSRLRIIHRDLKASNVLLDTDMNPKISDFGMARIFGRNETEANTRRVVGTYGYMSPEYQVDGTFSVRSDVFSFGVLVLEIISGKKNRGFFHPDHYHNLLGHAWMLYNEGKSLELVDANAIDSCYSSEILRSIHVALLCVQQYPEDRPSMLSVVLMLSSDMELLQPKEPGFFTARKPLEIEISTDGIACSSNGVTITLLDAR